MKTESNTRIIKLLPLATPPAGAKYIGYEVNGVRKYDVISYTPNAYNGVKYLYEIEKC